MKRISLFLFLQLALFTICYPQGEEQIIIDQYRKFLIITTPQSPEQIRSLTNDLQSAANKVNVKNVEQAKWAVLKILQTTRDLSIAWSKEGSPVYNDNSTLRLMNGTLEACLKVLNKNSDWSLSQMDIAQSVRDITMMLGKDLAEESRNKCIELMKNHRLQGSAKGADLLLTNELGIHYGALIKDAQQITRCRNFILDEIVVSKADGIQPDMSFHHHGKRLNIFHYGKQFLFDNIRVAWQLQNTPWAFPEEKNDLLADVILKGWQWMARGTTTVPGALDSFVTNEGALQSADIRSLIPFVKDLSPKKASAIDKFELIQNGKAQPTGVHYWPYSDFMAYHQNKFSIFIKTISERTLPLELSTGQSSQVNLLNNGNTYFVHDGKEYAGLMPVWNWRLLPGATSFTKGSTIGRTQLAGNVNNGKSSMTAMHFRLKDSLQRQDVSCHKVWAIHDGIMVCLMSDLRGSTSGSALTSVDQCKWRGPVTVNKAGNILKEGQNKLKNVRWIHHAGFVYIPLFSTPMNIELKTVTGNWKTIDQSQRSTMVTEKIFNPVIDHGHITDTEEGAYAAYAIAHATSVRQADSIASNPDWHILRDFSDCQAVRFVSDETIMAAFFSPCHLVNDKIGPEGLEVNKPCLVLIEDGKLYVSDIGYTGGPVWIKWNNKVFNVVMPPNGATIEASSDETP